MATWLFLLLNSRASLLKIRGCLISQACPSFSIFLSVGRIPQEISIPGPGLTLEDVSPRITAESLIWLKGSDRPFATGGVSYISTSFNWMIEQGSRTAANPVARWRRPRTQKRKPRPLPKEGPRIVWSLLEERGHPRVRFAAALGQEAAWTRRQCSCALYLSAASSAKWLNFAWRKAALFASLS